MALTLVISPPATIVYCQNKPYYTIRITLHYALFPSRGDILSLDIAFGLWYTINLINNNNIVSLQCFQIVFMFNPLVDSFILFLLLHDYKNVFINRISVTLWWHTWCSILSDVRLVSINISVAIPHHSSS